MNTRSTAPNITLSSTLKLETRPKPEAPPACFMKLLQALRASEATTQASNSKMVLTALEEATEASETMAASPAASEEMVEF